MPNKEKWPFMYDQNLSLKAKGLMFFLILNKNEDVKVGTKFLMDKNRDGQDSINSGLGELTDAGYFLKLRYRDKQTKKIKGSIWTYAKIPGEFNLDLTVQDLEKRGMEFQLKTRGNSHV